MQVCPALLMKRKVAQSWSRTLEETPFSLSNPFRTCQTCSPGPRICFSRCGQPQSGHRASVLLHELSRSGAIPLRLAPSLLQQRQGLLKTVGRLCRRLHPHNLHPKCTGSNPMPARRHSCSALFIVVEVRTERAPLCLVGVGRTCSQYGIEGEKTEGGTEANTSPRRRNSGRIEQGHIQKEGRKEDRNKDASKKGE